MDSEVSSKKLKKSKSKKSKTPVEAAEEGNHNVHKQQELMRVIRVKNHQLQNDSLSYLDYIELKEELFRLNALMDTFNSME